MVNLFRWIKVDVVRNYLSWLLSSISDDDDAELVCVWWYFFVVSLIVLTWRGCWKGELPADYCKLSCVE